MEQVKVKMQARWYIECPNCSAEEDVDAYEISVFKCAICGCEREYNSDPANCEQY